MNSLDHVSWFRLRKPLKLHGPDGDQNNTPPHLIEMAVQL